MAAEVDPLLGATLGAYRIEGLLGVGGMGRVYQGVQPVIGSRVAIKVLSNEHAARGDLVERFFAEAKVVNVIRHEAIVNVLDLNVMPDGRPYIVMELLEGAPLSALIAARLPIGTVGRMLCEVLDAVGAAHDKGVVHRDLKPDNIFIAPSGRPKVLDFGIAKLDAASSSTRTGALLGTPHYMSPEQCAGRPVDLRADIYALGVILFECVTGRRPFVAASLYELLQMHVDAPPPSARALRPEVPLAVEHVILRALAKRPEDRFATARAMSAALQHAIATVSPDQWEPLAAARALAPSPSGSATATAPATAPSRSRGGLLAGAGIGILAIGITAAALARRSPEAPPAEAGADPAALPVRALPPVPSSQLGAAALPPPDAPAVDAAIDAAIDAAPDAAVFDAQRWPLAITTLDYPALAQVVDPDEFFAFAAAEMRARAPDIALVRYALDGVGPDGTVDLALRTHGNHPASVTVRMFSPARAERDPSARLGLAATHRCELQLSMVRDGVRFLPLPSACAGLEAVRPPRCSVRAIWAKAIARGAPRNAVATLFYAAAGRGRPPRWAFAIYDQGRSVFSEWIPDDCP